jgi:ABC-type sugar transport system ATPase subunit
MDKSESKDIILRMEGIRKEFPPVVALADVTFSVRRGSVCALCGENGAGKSTLMKILAGVHAPDSGRITLDGEERHFASPADAISAGISMLYQELDLAGDLAVFENVFLGREIVRGPLQCVDEEAEIRIVREMARKHGFPLDPLARVASLSAAQCQLVELLKALLGGARLVIMDEPTSALSEAEAERLFGIVRDLRSNGISVIYISHRLEEVLALADDVCVLRDGSVVFSAPAAGLDTATLVRHMVGREISQYYPPRPNTPPGPVLFEARSLTTKRVRDISFTVREGEIVGLAGLVGAGRSETAEAIFGVDPLLSGEMLLDGRPLSIKGPADAIAAGIGYLTEDRARTGLCAELPCSWNVALPNYPRLGMRRVVSPPREREAAATLGARMHLKWGGPDDPASSLSGGNQQKLLVSRWLLADSRLLVIDEPTRGIDVGAKAEIYALLRELAAAGKAILLISSELPELLGLADRVLVMRGGKIAGELAGDAATPEAVMRLAALEQESPNE